MLPALTYCLVYAMFCHWLQQHVMLNRKANGARRLALAARLYANCEALAMVHNICSLLL